MADQTYPRVLYRGPADATAETCSVADADAEQAALTGGWRRRRVPPGAADPDPADPLTDPLASGDAPDAADDDADAEAPAAKPAPKRKR